MKKITMGLILILVVLIVPSMFAATFGASSNSSGATKMHHSATVDVGPNANAAIILGSPITNVYAINPSMVLDDCLLYKANNATVATSALFHVTVWNVAYTKNDDPYDTSVAPAATHLLPYFSMTARANRNRIDGTNYIDKAKGINLPRLVRRVGPFLRT